MVACKAVDNYMYKQVAWCEDEFHVDPLPIAKGTARSSSDHGLDSEST